MPRQERNLDRDAGVLKDASIIVVASEDTFAVKQYFKRFRTKKIEYRVLPTLDGCSSASALLERLDEFRKSNTTSDDDKFWICFDLDHRGQGSHANSLNAILAACHSKKYGVAISNPSFELWILLHFEDLNSNSDTTNEGISARLSEIHGGYNKAKCCGHLPFTVDRVHLAIERARKLDTGNALPTTPMANVYRILLELIEREFISIE